MLKTYYFLCLSFLFIITDVVRCNPDYVFNLKAGGWFKLHSIPEAWEDAFLRCHKDGAVLASPLNKELAKALLSQMTRFGLNGRIFLGIHDLISKGNFASVEGVALSDMDIRWGSRGNGTDTGDCLTMSDDGNTYYSSCEEPLPFVCYRKLDNQTMNECGTLDNEYQLNQQTGSCYKIHLDRQTWTRAYSICASEGGHLVILNDENEAVSVKDMFPVTNRADNGPWDGFFVGLLAWGKERIWTTIHGEKIEDVFNEWYPGEPNNYAMTQDRALLLWNGTLDDVSKDSTYEYTRMFACEKSPESKRFKNLPPCIERMVRLCSACDESHK